MTDFVCCQAVDRNLYWFFFPEELMCLFHVTVRRLIKIC